MAKLTLMLSTFLALKHEVTSQILRQPLGLLNQPLETIIEPPRQYIQQVESPGQYLQFESPRYITQQIIEPYNNGIPTLSPNFPNNVPTFPINTQPTTLITDCTPSVCKNLINTIQLMIVSNLLQNKKGKDEIGLQLPGPFLNNLVALRNPVSRPNLISSNVGASSPIAPRFVNSLTPNVDPSNILSSLPPNGQIDRDVITNVFKLLSNGLL